MNTNEILNSQQNKTQKIKQLLELGLTRKQVAELMGVGYGFVQNVYAKYFNTQTRQTRTNIFSRKFGVEIEAFFTIRGGKARLKEAIEAAGVSCNLESYNHETRNAWKIISDSSISNTQSHQIFEAFEIVSPPLVGLAGLEELKKVCDALESVGAKINKTTGLHIHFEAVNFDLQTWKNLFYNYAKYEKAIDDFMPRSRRASTNTYCKSLDTTLLQKVQNATTVQQLANSVGTRYYKINVQSYLRHKTIEFRHHSGSIEFEKIKNWIYFLHHLVEFSTTKKTQNENLDAMNEFLPTEILDFYKLRTEELN
jgi:hypothetical protein